jgi:hypothetical protein
MTDPNRHLNNDQLQAYLDGVLEPSIIVNLQAHLETCPICREELVALEILETSLSSLPALSLGRDLSSSVVSQLREEKSLSPAITWTLIFEALAAGTVIALLIPAFQAAGWLPRLLDTSLELRAAVNIFTTQLASNWLWWWASLKLQFNQFLGTNNPLVILPGDMISPWILIGSAGGLVILLNALLLGRQTIPNGNHKHIKV